MFFFILGNLNKRLQTEIDNYLQEVKEVLHHRRLATSASFVLSRAKLKHTAFIDANNQVLDYYYSNFNHKTYNGYRLLAIDGTILTVPKTKENIKKFGENILHGNGNSGKWLKSQVSFASDVLNNICADAQIDAYKSSEREMAVNHINQLGKNNLYLFDRGYYSFSLLETLTNSSNAFCFRVHKKANKQIIDFVNSNKTDELVSIRNIVIRLTKVQLKTGQTEYLLSSLFDLKKYPPKELKRLYNMRWGIEEQYKDVKHAIGIENFSGKSYEFIKQDFYAKVLSYNLSMILFKNNTEKQANKSYHKKKKHKYLANKRAILAKFKQTFVRIFVKYEDIIDIIISTTQSLAKEAVPIRNGRVYKRLDTFKAKRKVARAYISVS